LALPLLNYAPTTQNNRVAPIRVSSDEDARAVALDIAADSSNLDTVIESAYRQIFFHAFKADREPFLESQLRNGQITVRDFIRGLCLSNTFQRSFYNLNSNYKVVRHLVEKVLGRKTHGQSEEISWSIVLATKGVGGMVDALLDSQEYLDTFGYDTVPYQRNRVLPGRELGETPFNITSPRYDAYYRGILGFPQIVYTGTARSLPARAAQRRGGYPEDYMAWVRSLPAMRTSAAAASSASIDYMAKVPYRSVGR
jgi:phycobilisome rod-core linker protein